MPSFTFYGGRKQARTKFSGIFFLFPNLDKLLDKTLCESSWSSTPGEFAYIWQSKRVGIIAMKFKENPQLTFFLSCRPVLLASQIDHRWRQNVVKTKKCYLADPRQHGTNLFVLYVLNRKQNKKRHTCLVPLDCSRICASLGNFQVINAAFRICFFFLLYLTCIHFLRKAFQRLLLLKAE